MKKFSAFCAFVLLLAGCATKDTPIDSRLEMDDTTVGFLQLEDKIASRTSSGGITQAQAIFKNTSSRDKEIVYKIDWFDKDGLMIDSINSKWKRALVQGSRNFVVKAVSPSDKAVDFKIRILKPTSADKRMKTINNYKFKN